MTLSRRSDTALGVILAGGRATRLGPLAAQYNKSLVTVGQKPQLVRQVQQLRAAGCDEVRVVISPGAEQQVAGVISRACLPTTTVTVQPEACGPGDALRYGAIGHRGPVTVLMSDTLLEQDDVPTHDDSLCCWYAPTARNWCYRDDDDDRLYDGYAPAGSVVAVGAYRFSDGHALWYSANEAPEHNGEVGMADVLNLYNEWHELRVVRTPSWRDVGDVAALAAANREHVISRSFHSFTMPEPGIIVKHGADVAAEGRVMVHCPARAQHLYPRVYDVRARAYAMEHIDTPSLAELYLYWPSKPDMWAHVGRELVDQLRRNMWSARSTWCASARAHEMYVKKLQDRYTASSITAWRPDDEITVNGVRLPAGAETIARVTDLMETRFARTTKELVWTHGDPNFTNVLWSLRTGSFKLLDPRPRWGGVDPWGDWRYDVGKIAYSPIFAPIVHGLFDIKHDEDDWRLRIWPKRDAEIEQLWRELPLENDDLQLLSAYMLLSGAPLHDGDEANALYITGSHYASQL